MTVQDPTEQFSELAAADAPPPDIRYHFLDVGGLKYGECVVVEASDVRIMIDGGHRSDFRGQPGYRSIPKQLEALFGLPPHKLTLLVVTHGHDDHIGCLLDLLTSGVIAPEFALMTDPHLGFGRAHDDVDDDRSSGRSALAAVLREEDVTDLADRELSDFIDAVATAEERYTEILDRLRDAGTQVHLHRGGPLPEAVQAAVEPTGLVLLGPSEAQLLYCAEAVGRTNTEARDALDALGGVHDTLEIVSLYRELASPPTAFDAGSSRGNGMNCQSITLAFGPPGARALIAGDMQFAEPGVAGADDEVSALRQAAIDHGPYRLFKTTHHTSHNGQDGAFLDALGSPRLIVHSGGLKDSRHPFPALLEKLSRRRGLRFARTDRNGLITVQPHLEDDAAVRIDRGRINDFTDNRAEDEFRISATGRPAGLPPAPVPEPVPTSAGPQIIIINLPPGPIDLTVAGVDIQVRAPTSRSPRPGGRDLSNLLFLTYPAKLRANIGQAETDNLLAAVEAAGGRVVTGAGEALQTTAAAALRADLRLKGVVVLGGYDVVPSIRTDAIGQDLRTRLAEDQETDIDDFWIWSDRLYGDRDGDHLAEVPVSRLPDGHDARLLATSLAAAAFEASDRFGVRNVARPFAAEIWEDIPGVRGLEVSEPFGPETLDPAQLDATAHYLMLHGRASDGRRFQGELADTGESVTAFRIQDVPRRFNGVVFSGCCWGALTVDEKACDLETGDPTPRLAQASIPLAYLAAGASAFIGCTGAHYSGPIVDADNNYAYRLHQGFFRELSAGAPPALALHRARHTFLTWILRTPSDPLDAARRLKNAHQFTCLGLGW